MSEKETIYIKKEFDKVVDPVASVSFKELLSRVQECIDAARKENIRANSIVINENMVKVKPFLVKSDFMVHPSPPMICGLNVYFDSKTLPDGYSFAVCEGVDIRKPELDICGAIDYIYERTYIDQEVLKKVLELYKEYMEG